MGDRPSARQPVDLLIFIEHVARELDVTCALKHLLGSRHGVSVAISSILAAHGRSQALKQVQPRVVALPFFYEASDNGPADVVVTWPDAVYVNLAYEQLFTKINQPFKAPRDVFAREHVLQHSWGQFAADYLQSYGVLGENIFRNGNPSYALYLPPYAHFYPSRGELAQQYGLDERKRWVLIPENYGAAFYSEARLKEYIRSGSPEAYDYREFALNSFRQAIVWWQTLAAQPDVEVIVRPRPAIPMTVFEHTCRNTIGEIPDRMHIIKDGSVREWILGSDLVISSYSTTLIEAAIADKPVYMMEPLPFPDYVIAEWYEHVPRLKTLGAFIEKTSMPTLEPSHLRLQHWARASMLSHEDVIGRLAGWLAAVVQGQTHLPARPPQNAYPTTAYSQRSYFDRHKHLLNPVTLLKRLRSRLGVKPPDDPSFMHDQDAFTQADVDAKTRRWQQILG